MGKKYLQKKDNVFKGESNPFNLKINREKRCILGQKMKGTKGLRGVSRGESHAKRKELWHKTKLSVEKANKFLDKRLLDESLEPEESTVKRLVKERKQKLKKNIFNLNDDELTHEGKPLTALEDLSIKKADSDDEEQLDSGFVSQAHFGGFESKDSTSKSHKEVLDELIIESKKKKYEKKLENEKNEEMIDSLDKGWKELLAVTGIKAPHVNPPPIKNDAYDIIAQELKFEKRGAPTSRIKSEEELQLEEKEKMKRLEAERQLRMIDEMEFKAKKATDHLSADSILDDFDLAPIPVEEPVNDEVSPQLEDSNSDDSDEEYESSSELIDEMEEEAVCDATKAVESLFTQKDVSVIPHTLEEFETAIEMSNKNVSELVEEILKPYKTAKSDMKVNKLCMFFDILIQYTLNTLTYDPSIASQLAPLLFTITEISPLKCGQIFLSYLDKEEKFFQESKGKKKKSHFPRPECIVLLKYSTVFYSVSDFRHPIVTPAIIFMCDILSCVFRITFQNIVARLHIGNLLYDCVSQSKRFVPEVLYFLNKILRLAINTDSNCSDDRSESKKINLLLKKEPTSSKIVCLNSFKFDQSIPVESVKLSIICKSITLLHKFADLYQDLPSYPEIFALSLSILSKLPLDVYPLETKNLITNFKSIIEVNTKVRCPLVYKDIKPKPLKLFEPAFESKFNKKDDIKKKLKQLKQISQKIKKEEKGVLREMRQDVQMIAAEKLAETLENDAERKRKVKELYHDLAVQEGDYKKMMKKKPAT